MGGFTPIIDSTGKITGYKTKAGADTVFPFKSVFTIPTLALSSSCNSYDFFGQLFGTFTVNTEGYEKLTISSVETRLTSSPQITWNGHPIVKLKSGDTVISTLANGATNLSFDISSYDSITIYVGDGLGVGLSATLTNVTFSW